MTNICTSNLTSGFIDLATFDEIEKYMYGGPEATAYFVRECRKSTWFTQVPVVLSKCSGSPSFGSEWSVQISRAGDYLLQTWLRVELPEVAITNNISCCSECPTNATSEAFGCVSIRWTRNLGHALIRECCLTFNDLVAARFDNYHLDFWSAFTTPAGKQNGYDNMIGNTGALAGMGDPHVLPAAILNVPLPFVYTRDSGVALPTAALPYNDMRIQFQFRSLSELLIADYCVKGSRGWIQLENDEDGAAQCVRLGEQNSRCLDNNSIGNLPETVGCRIPCPPDSGVATDCGLAECAFTWVPLKDQSWKFVNGEPRLGAVNVWANYAIVSNDERKRMACAPRDILIEQVQTAPPCGFNPLNVATPCQYDVRFSHAIKVLFFAVRNKTLACEHANYTTAPAQPILNCLSSVGGESGTLICTARSFDPIAAASLLYENTFRLAHMGSDYYSLVEPYYFAPVIPEKTGYHMYSYSLDFYNLDPMGSTNYGKLTNVSLYITPSQAAVDAASATQFIKGSSSCNPCKLCNSSDICQGGISYQSNCSSEGDDCGSDLVIYCQQQTFEFIVTAVNNNIVRISGGALGFPVL